MVFSLNDHIAVLKPKVPGLILSAVNLHYAVRRRGSPEGLGPIVLLGFSGTGFPWTAWFHHVR